jgi:hypothetical protein
MVWKLSMLGICAAAIAAMAYASAPAGAAQKKKTAASPQAKTVVASKPRARVRVQPRSFLDVGTDSIPGDNKYTDYALPSGYSPFRVIDNTAFSHRSPLPGAYDLPSRSNPWPWNY